MSDDDLGGAPAPSSSVARPAPGLSRKRPRVAEAARPLAGLAQEELEPGPPGLLDVLDFPARFACDLRRHDEAHQRGLSNQFQQTIRGGVVLTTCYSGMGGAETAAEMLAAYVENLAPGSPCAGIHIYSAADIMPRAQKALLGHHPALGPGHVFVDVLDRLPEDVRLTCVGIQNSKLEAFKLAHDDRRASATLKLTLGQELFNELSDVLDNVEFLQEAPCLRHGIKCPTNLRLDAMYRDMVHVEIAGTTCTAWSAMGRSMGYLDKSTLPCLVRLYSTRYYEPDGVVHENAPRFQHHRLLEVLAGKRRRARRGPGPRNPFSPRKPAVYEGTCAVFSPEDLGVPSGS